MFAGGERGLFTAEGGGIMISACCRLSSDWTVKSLILCLEARTCRPSKWESGNHILCGATYEFKTGKINP